MTEAARSGHRLILLLPGLADGLADPHHGAARLDHSGTGLSVGRGILLLEVFEVGAYTDARNQADVADCLVEGRDPVVLDRLPAPVLAALPDTTPTPRGTALKKKIFNSVQNPKMGTYKRKQESKKTRQKERKQELDQENDQEKKKVFSFFLGRFLGQERVLFLCFLFS